MIIYEGFWWESCKLCDRICGRFLMKTLEGLMEILEGFWWEFEDTGDILIGILIRILEALWWELWTNSDDSRSILMSIQEGFWWDALEGFTRHFNSREREFMSNPGRILMRVQKDIWWDSWKDSMRILERFLWEYGNDTVWSSGRILMRIQKGILMRIAEFLWILGES